MTNDQKTSPAGETCACGVNEELYDACFSAAGYLQITLRKDPMKCRPLQKTLAAIRNARERKQPSLFQDSGAATGDNVPERIHEADS